MKRGTLKWAEKTGGKLRFQDKFLFLTNAIALQLKTLPAEFFWKLSGKSKSQVVFDPDDYKSPDTEMTRLAEKFCREISSPFLVNHCLRTYLWGSFLAAQQKISFDKEIFYVASLLHDVGLTSYTDNRSESCFAVRGGLVAKELLADASWSEARQNIVAEAIMLHLNISVSPSHGMEAHLLNAATALDVIGLRYWELSPDSIQAVLKQMPRLALKEQIWPLWKNTANANPGCRSHFMNRYLQFKYRLFSSPFEE